MRLKIAILVQERNGIERAMMAATVFFGANDACIANRLSVFPHVPLEEYKQNLRTIVSIFKESLHRKSGWVPERTNEAAGAYVKACLEVTSECGLSCIDLWTKMQLIPDWKTACLSDWLHLTETGNRIVFKEVIVKLKENGLSLESMPVDLPLIGEIDPKNPLKSFEKI